MIFVVFHHPQNMPNPLPYPGFVCLDVVTIDPFKINLSIDLSIYLSITNSTSLNEVSAFISFDIQQNCI